MGAKSLFIMYKDTLITRFFLTLGLGIIAAIVVNEISFYFLKSESGRAPQEVIFEIPPGTAKRLAAGEDIKIIPEGSKFVIGDKLTIKNFDSTNHTFGDLFIPEGASASTIFNYSNNYAYSCSFQSQSVLGFEVYEPVSSWIRLGGVLLAGVPLGVLFWIYGILVIPIKKNEETQP